MRSAGRRAAIAIALVPVCAGPAAAGTANGAAALALAALVARQSPVLAIADKRTVLGLYEGHPKDFYPAGQKITVTADKIVCKAGNVDVTLHECDLVFGGKTVALTGARAHTIYATIGEIGVPPDGAAGMSYEALSQLRCTIDPSEIARKSGGGAECTFSPGAG
jgi:hypothetical protein